MGDRDPISAACGRSPFHGAVVAVTLLTWASPPSGEATTGVLHRYALDDSLTLTVLAPALDEISGLAFDDTGRLWAHHDEAARIFELDPVSGKILGSFDVGRWGWTLGGDWEGLTWAGDRFFLVDSDGTLLEFRRGRPGERVAYRRIRSGAGRRCEIEGLAFDAPHGVLLMGCKSPRRRELADGITLFAVPLAAPGAEAVARIRIPAETLDDFHLPGRFAVSALDLHPDSGTLLVASARQEAVVEIDSEGTVLAARRLPGRALPQAEGLAVGPDGTLFLASEAAGDRPRLARVPMNGGAS